MGSTGPLRRVVGLPVENFAKNIFLFSCLNHISVVMSYKPVGPTGLYKHMHRKNALLSNSILVLYIDDRNLWASLYWLIDYDRP